MGVVVAATHLQLGQLFALKFLLPHMCEHGEAVERFAREARAAVQIQSEHVARVTDVGTLESGAPYMVMEYLLGSDLSEVLQSRGPLAVAEAVGFLLQACEAIAEAHALGIVHRDLKPANMFLTRRRDGSPLVKVLDFGISKALQDTLSSPSVTSTSMVMGSPIYMSPEQVRSSKSVDARSDVWSLGVILQELLTGAPTYEAETASALMAMIAADPPTPLRQRRPDAPVELEAAILRCLEKDRERRMPNVAELARAIAPFGAADARASVERISRVLGGVGSSGTVFETVYDHAVSGFSASGGTADAWEQTQPRPRRGKGVLVAVLAGLGAGAAGLLGVLLWGAHPAVPAANPAQQKTTELGLPTAAAPAAPPTAGVVEVTAPSSVPVAAALAAAPASALPPTEASTVAKVKSPPVRPKNKAGAAHHAAGEVDLFDDNK